jgi:hypothetical protein
MADKLDKKLSWISDCENGLENIVRFFQETNDFEESYVKFQNFLFIYSDKKKKRFIENIYSFILKIERSKNGWNRTLKCEIPSMDSIFILTKDEEEIDLFPIKKVSFHIERKKNPLNEEQLLSEKFSSEKLLGTKVVDDYVIDYMKKSCELLQKALHNFKAN